MNFNKIWCFFGSHKDIIKRNQRGVYQKFKAQGWNHLDSWAAASPKVCKNCERIEPNYQRMMDELKKKYASYVRKTKDKWVEIESPPGNGLPGGEKEKSQELGSNPAKDGG